MTLPPLPEALAPWAGPVVAALLALAWAGLARLRRRPDLAGLGAGLGLAAGWLLTLGQLTGSPRQLPERLPALALAAGLLGLLLALAGRRGWVTGPLAALGLLGAGWWLAGGPLTPADLGRAGVPLLALAALGAAALLALRGPVPAAAALALLAAGLWLYGPPGPWWPLALVAPRRRSSRCRVAAGARPRRCRWRSGWRPWRPGRCWPGAAARTGWWPPHPSPPSGSAPASGPASAAGRAPRWAGPSPGGSR